MNGERQILRQYRTFARRLSVGHPCPRRTSAGQTFVGQIFVGQILVGRP
jgi:hypothetical protein